MKMASNHTKHLELNQWTGDDNFVRTDFNEDNAKIDAAVATKAELAWGSYRGTTNTPYADWRSINLGYYPQAVFVVMYGGTNSTYLGDCCSQLVTRDCPDADCLKLTQTGFQVRGALNQNYPPFNPMRYMVVK